MRRRHRLGITLLFLLALATPGLALNPKITRTLDRVTAAEAAAILTETTGVSVRVQKLFGPPPPAAAVQRLEEQASFDWRGKTLADALRDLADRYGLHVQRAGGGYLLYPLASRPEGPPLPEPLARTEKDGVQLVVRDLVIESPRRTDPRSNLILDWRGATQGQLMLVLDGRIRGGDGATLMGLANVIAKDDLGNILVQDYGRVFGPPDYDMYPDEWRSGVTLTAPHPNAKMLEWLEVGVQTARVYQPLQLDVALPEIGGTNRKQFDDLTLEVEFPRPPAAGAGRPQPFPGRALQARIFSPQGTFLYSPNGQYQLEAVLVSTTGKTYRGGTFSNSSNQIRDGKLRREFIVQLPQMSDALEKVRFDVVRKSGAQQTMTFRLKDIPLPREVPFIPRRVAVLEDAFRTTTARPFLQAGGGILASPVRVNRRPAPAGTLWLGLSRNVDGQWSKTSWLTVPIGSDGRGLLKDLEPGAYRLLRIYRPTSPEVLSGAGGWQQSELIFEVSAGQTVTVPPLEWKRKR